MKIFNFRSGAPVVTVALCVASVFPSSVMAQSVSSVPFADVAAQIEAGKWRVAEQHLQTMLRSDPSRLEYYINLAAVYARQGKLNQAKATLQQGLQAHQQAATLMVGLQRINGALAANAYQRALDKNTPDLPLKAVQLPVLRELVSQPSATVAPSQQVVPTESQVVELHEAEIAAMTAELAVQKQRYELKLDELQRQLSTQQAEIEALQARQLSWEAAEKAAIAPAVVVASQQPSVLPVETTSAFESPNSALSVPEASLDQAAIDHVRQWAAAWAARDKATYIGFYNTDYAPSDYVNRTQWLQQNDIYFDNAKAIQIDVSEFEVVDQGGSVVVTFTQRYQSASFEEASRKRLVFVLSNGDWQTAKIIKEQTVSG